MNEKFEDGSISFIINADKSYAIYLAADGDSGIKVTGNTKEECIKNLIPYLTDHFITLEKS